MTDQQHPIVPPPELMQQWREQAPRFRDGGIARENWLMTRAAQCAEQKLEACIDWVFIHHGQEQVELLMEHLRAARRPKTPSLKERALAHLEKVEQLIADLERNGIVPFHEKDDSIRRALEALPDD